MKVTDHLGNEFKSIKDMCEFHHIPSKIYDNRVNRHHWSMEKALRRHKKRVKNQLQQRQRRQYLLKRQCK